MIAVSPSSASDAPKRSSPPLPGSPISCAWAHALPARVKTNTEPTPSAATNAVSPLTATAPPKNPFTVASDGASSCWKAQLVPERTKTSATPPTA